MSMRSWLKYFTVIFLLMATPHALAHLDSVRMMVTFPNLVQQGFKIDAVGSSSGLKITGARLFVVVKQNQTTKEFPFIETQAGIYEILQPSLPPGAYNFKFVDRTFPNEALEYNIDTTLPRPIKQSSLMFVLPPTRGNSVQNQNVWLAVLAAPTGLILILAVGWFGFVKKQVQYSRFQN
jgi:hypothetical protein